MSINYKQEAQQSSETHSPGGYSTVASKYSSETLVLSAYREQSTSTYSCSSTKMVDDSPI